MTIIARRFCLSLLLLLAPAVMAQAAERCPASLPPAVVATRDAIAAAAHAGDWERMKALAGADFVYSFGDEGDPVGYWKQLLAEGVDVRRLIGALLAMPCAVVAIDGQRSYWWPSAAEFDWPELTPAEQRALETLYGGAIDEYYIEGRDDGYYIGWRLSIEADGAWSSFVAGD